MKKIIFGICLIGMLPSIAVARAELTPEQKGILQQERTKIAQEKAQIRVSQKQALAAERCNTVRQKIQNRTNQFDANKLRHANAYQNMKSRLDKFEVRLAEKGYDTTQFKADLAILDQKIQKFGTDYAAHIAKLKEAHTFSCGRPESEFRTKLAEAKELMVTVREDVLEIKDFYNTTIRPDLVAFKAQKPIVKEPSTSVDPSTPVTNPDKAQ
jgi:hypothetical protein